MRGQLIRLPSKKKKGLFEFPTFMIHVKIGIRCKRALSFAMKSEEIPIPFHVE